MIEIVVKDLRTASSRAKKVGVFRRKTRGKTYDSPRVNLNSKLNTFIGKSYREFQGRGTMELGGAFGAMEGDVIVLFFPDEWEGNTPSRDSSEPLTEGIGDISDSI